MKLVTTQEMKEIDKLAMEKYGVSAGAHGCRSKAGGRRSG